MYCREGNNTADGMALASHILYLLRLGENLEETLSRVNIDSQDETAQQTVRLCVPKSWSKVFGKEHDISLFE